MTEAAKAPVPGSGSHPAGAARRDRSKGTPPPAGVPVEPARASRAARVAAAIVALGVVLSAATWVLASRAYAAAARSRLEREADALVTAIGDAFSRSGDELYGLQGLFESVDRVAPATFETFARGILSRHPEIRGLSWNPRLPAASAEERRLLLASLGLGDLEPWERAADGSRRPARLDADAVVVGLISPLESNRAALGYDVSSEALRREALGISLATGRATRTAPLRLVQQARPSGSGILTVLPVLGPGRPKGSGSIPSAWVAQVSEPQVVVDSLQGRLWSRQTWALTIWDPGGGDRRLLALWGAEALSPGSPGTLSRRLVVGERPTTVVLRRLRPVRVDHEPWGMAGSILGFTALIGYVVWRLDRQRALAERLSRTDALTGLSNRRDFSSALEKVLERGLPVALVVLDVDHFKRVNDAYGHAAGDRVLQLVAATLQGVVRIATDRVGRLGGEEFGLLLTGLGEEEVRVVWRRLRAQLEGLAGSLPSRVTVSAGIAAPFLEPPESPLRAGALSVADAAEALMKGADAALYEAKRTGRDRAVLRRGEAFEPLGGEHPAKE